MIFDSYHTQKWSDKIRVWFSPPSWRPEDVSTRFPIEKNDLSSFEKYDPQIGLREKIFSWHSIYGHKYHDCYYAF